MTDYPILVAEFDAKHPADLAVCERCGAETTWNPEEGAPYDQCVKHSAPPVGGGAVCGGQIVFKYYAGSTCRGCGKLDYSHSAALNGCCSRACMLQVEYIATGKGWDA